MPARANTPPSTPSAAKTCVAFYKTYFHPNNMLLAVWGDFNAKQMIGKIKAVLGDWPAVAA